MTWQKLIQVFFGFAASIRTGLRGECSDFKRAGVKCLTNCCWSTGTLLLHLEGRKRRTKKENISNLAAAKWTKASRGCWGGQRSSWLENRGILTKHWVQPWSAEQHHQTHNSSNCEAEEKWWSLLTFYFPISVKKESLCLFFGFCTNGK